MNDLPVIFSAPMVRALLDGRKTMTRRLAWGKPMPGLYESSGGPLTPIPRPSPWQKVKPGDRLWVRENFSPCNGSDDRNPKIKDASYAVLADGAQVFRDGRQVAGLDEYAPGALDNIVWRPSIHMPRWASRLTLTVTATKIERLQEMSAPDAIAEGIEMESADPPFYYVPGIWPHSITAVGIEEPGRIPHAVRSFAKLWTHLHGAESWDANPEVVALTFTVAKQNIDRSAS